MLNCFALTQLSSVTEKCTGYVECLCLQVDLLTYTERLHSDKD